MLTIDSGWFQPDQQAVRVAISGLVDHAGKPLPTGYVDMRPGQPTRAACILADIDDMIDIETGNAAPIDSATGKPAVVMPSFKPNGHHRILSTN
jgi:hypothetical protein